MEIALYNGDPLLFHSDYIVHSAGSAMWTSFNSMRTVDPGTVGSTKIMSDGLSSTMQHSVPTDAESKMFTCWSNLDLILHQRAQDTLDGQSLCPRGVSCLEQRRILYGTRLEGRTNRASHR